MTSQARYPHVMRLVSETPWAIRAEKLVAIREILALRAAGERFSAEEIEARLGAAPAAQRSKTPPGSVAVLPLFGVMIPRANLMSEMSGGTSVEQFSASFRAAMADPSIGAILLNVDSPGGMTDLVPELAAEVRAARGRKPIVAIANTDMASAAYWVGSQADELVVSPSATVGSIGVFAAHEDVSGQQEADGVKTTLISAGKYKVESNPFAPLSDEARAAIQGRVDAFYTMFTRDVAKGRGVPIADVRGGFGEGRVVTAQTAVELGMADRVATFEATVERLLVQAATGQPATAVGASSTYITVAEQFAPGESPPGDGITDYTSEAADSGLSFAAAAIAVRDAADRLTTDAASLCDGHSGRLTAAKRDILTAAAESLRGSAEALAGLVATNDPALALTDGQRAFVTYVRSKQR